MLSGKTTRLVSTGNNSPAAIDAAGLVPERRTKSEIWPATLIHTWMSQYDAQVRSMNSFSE
jgi:hypothetical protein